MDTKKESAAKWVDIDKVKPWGRNPKRLEQGDINRMVRSIERFGWADVIVAREADGEIISGHLRHAAAKSLGMAKVPVRYLPIDSAEAHALAVAVTQHEAVRTFDESIGALLADMQEEGIDLDGLGWSEDELRDIIAAGQVEELEPEDPDDVPEVATVAHSVKGEVYELGPHRLVCGDATKEATWQKLGQTKKASLLLTDPPYCSGGFQEAGRSVGSIGTRDDKVIARDALSTRGYQAMISQVLDLCACQACAMFTDWRMWVNLFDLHESSGFGVRSMVVWDKGSPGMGLGFRSTHELALISTKVKAFSTEHCGSNIIRAKRTGNELHPTQKPVDLLCEILRVFGKFGTIVDPFGGSGSTLMACAETGRVARLIELDPKYCDVIRRRWTRYAKKNGLDAGPGALKDADVEA